MENLLKFVGVDIIRGGLIQVEMKDDNNKSYHVFFEPSRFFSELGWVMYSNYKKWTAKENLRKFTYTKDDDDERSEK